MDNTLDYIDQASFLGLRALGHGPVIQFTWIYTRDVDLDGLRRFHRNLGQGLLGRRIARSPLPFGRHRWIAWPGPSDIVISPSTRSRGEIHSWFDEQAALPIDPECGPPWRLTVQPLIEGGAAVSLVLSHTVADGVGATIAVAEAVKGVDRNLGYPAAARPSKTAAMLADLRQFLRDIPSMFKAAVAVARVARSRGDALSASVRESKSTEPGSGQPVTISMVTVYADAELWDRRAAELGGTPTSLFIGLTCRLGWRLGWLNDQGVVEITVPVNDRTEGDTRGNALTQVSMTVDPIEVYTDLSMVRADLKTALTTVGEDRHELLTPLPLVPLVPKVVARRLEGLIIGAGGMSSSNLGQLDPAANRPDGTDADFFAVRMAESLTRADVRRTGGSFLPVGSGRVNGQIFISIGYTNADGTTTRADVTQWVRDTLEDFGLTARIE